MANTETIAGTENIPDLPDASEVPPLPVEVGLHYTYAEPYGNAEITYILPAGRWYILTSGEEVLNEDLKPAMRVLLKEGAVATSTHVELEYEMATSFAHPTAATAGTVYTAHRSKQVTR